MLAWWSLQRQSLMSWQCSADCLLAWASTVTVLLSKAQGASNAPDFNFGPFRPTHQRLPNHTHSLPSTIEVIITRVGATTSLFCSAPECPVIYNMSRADRLLGKCCGLHANDRRRLQGSPTQKVTCVPWHVPPRHLAPRMAVVAGLACAKSFVVPAKVRYGPKEGVRPYLTWQMLSRHNDGPKWTQ